MLKRNIKNIKLLWLLTSAAILFLCAVLCGALLQEKPDLAQIKSTDILMQDQQMFSCPNGDFWVTSTDGKRQTKLALLYKKDGSWKTKLLSAFFMNAQRVFQEDGGLYFAGMQGTTLTVIYWSPDTSKKQCTLSNVQWDSGRYGTAEAGGILYFVTCRKGESITDDTPVTVYYFNASSRLLEVKRTFPQPDTLSSEEPEESEVLSDPDSNASCVPSSVPSSEPISSKEESSEESKTDDTPEFYLFSNPVTVSDLSKNFLEHTGTVNVLEENGRIRASGHIVTGDLIEIMGDGKTDSRVTACIRGDITGSGNPGTRDVTALYQYLTDNSYLTEAQKQAADFDKDGVLTTSDLLALKQYISN